MVLITELKSLDRIEWIIAMTDTNTPHPALDVPSLVALGLLGAGAFVGTAVVLQKPVRDEVLIASLREPEQSEGN